MEYQNGLPIGYNIEMFEYGAQVPVKNRKFNANFFKDRPDLLTDEIKRKMNKQQKHPNGFCMSHNRFGCFRNYYKNIISLQYFLRHLPIQ